MVCRILVGYLQNKSPQANGKQNLRAVYLVHS